MAQRGFAIAAFREGPQWRAEPLPPTVLDDLGVLLSALRSQPPEGGPFVVAFVEDEFFVIARQEGRRISLLLSDLTAAVEFPLAEQAMVRLGEDPPADDELDEVWPVGDLDLFADVDISEDEVEDILDDLDLLPDEMLDTIMERLEMTEQYGRAIDAAWVRWMYFAAVLVRLDDTWTGREADLGGCESLDDLGDLLRDDDGDVRLLVIEQDDEYAALVRLDGVDDDPRAFLTDGHAADAYPMAAVVAEDLVEIGGDDLADDDDAPPAHDSAPFGDADIVEDLGTSSVALIGLCEHEGTLPVDLLLAVCEKAGCGEVFEELRGVNDADAMGAALELARASAAAGEIPVGAVVLSAAGEVIASAHNEREAGNDPTAHAEVVALRRAGAALGSWQLPGATLVVTLEPCTMCAGALVLARVGRVVFGAWDDKAGAVGSLWDVVRDRRLNHRPEVVAGVRADECGAVLREFFAAKRRPGVL